MIIECPVSLGELVDKVTILMIKQEKIKDEEKLKNVRNELDFLSEKLKKQQLKDIETYLEQLKEVNTQLWEIEDDIRILEKKAQFNEEFVSLARAVYKTNDRRFVIKNTINNFYGSNIKEVKSYEEY